MHCVSFCEFSIYRKIIQNWPKSFETIGIPFCNSSNGNSAIGATTKKKHDRLNWTYERMCCLCVSVQHIHTKKNATQRFIDNNSKRVDPGQSRMPINFNWLWLVQDLKLYWNFRQNMKWCADFCIALYICQHDIVNILV